MGYNTHPLIESWRVIVLVLDDDTKSADIVQLRFTVIRRPYRHVYFFLIARWHVSVEHLQKRTGLEQCEGERESAVTFLQPKTFALPNSIEQVIIVFCFVSYFRRT